MRRIGIVLALLVAGCDRGGGGGAPPPPPSIPIIQEAVAAEAPPVGPFVNDASTTVDLLDFEAALDRDSATNIIDTRDGITVTPTAIASLEDLDPIPEVGPVTLARVERFAANWADFDPDPLLAFLNSPATTHAVLRTIVTAAGTTSLPSATAQAIIDWRSAGDPFDSRSEVLNVTGVGVARLQDIENHVGLGRATAEDPDTAADLRAVAFSPDGLLALFAGRSDAGESALLYDTTAEDAFEGDVAHAFTIRRFDLSGLGASDLHDVAWAPSGDFAIAVGEGGKALRFDREAEAWSDISPAGLASGVLGSVAISASGDAAFVAALEEGLVLRHDLGARRWGVVATGDVAAVGFSNARVFDFTAEKGIALAPAAAGRILAVASWGTVAIDARLGEDFRSSGFDPDGRRGIAAGSRGAAVALEIQQVTVNAQPAAFVAIDRLATRSVRDLHAVALHPREPYSLLVGERGEVLLYDFARGSSSRLTLRDPSDTSKFETRALRDVAFEPKGTYALIVGEAGALFRYVPSR